MSVDPDALEQTCRNAIGVLLDARDRRGVWTGKLSASALSTAVSIFALHLVGDHEQLVSAGRDWLLANRNADGGWGDTVDSLSNISTTTLCHAALHAVNVDDTTSRAWLTSQVGNLTPDTWSRAIADRYGEDRTFSVPILTMAALSGVLGDDGFRYVSQLPFELAAFPRQWFSKLRLSVVSYALPALIAIGQVRHQRRPTSNPIARLLRSAVRHRTLDILRAIQPESGGYLEATPLTGFVVMSLVAAGLKAHPVVRDGASFLADSFRDDGSVPIDTNLATWVTTLSVNALAQIPEGVNAMDTEAIFKWIIDQQYRVHHPYTDSPPGGFAWTDLSGGVPDADDTSGALLALHALNCGDIGAIESGISWLLNLQNRDGGIPTFCRGWGRLPFDRSSTDITAHALRSWHAWQEQVSSQLQSRITNASSRAVGYLESQQYQDGSWRPLWFGNERHPESANLTYGTARVVLGLPETSPARQLGLLWLLKTQNPDGGWGGDRGIASTIEETAVSVRALPRDHEAVKRGVRWLIEHTERGQNFPASPIGFYFANLWYSEKLYPLIWTVEALQHFANE